jgi:hypothetical protein
MKIQKNYRNHSRPVYRRPLFYVWAFFAVLMLGVVVCVQHYTMGSATSVVKPPAVFPSLSAGQGLYTLDVNALAANRDLYKKGDANTQHLVSQLVKSADKAAAQPIKTVMDKNQTPPSGDKHDYMSLAIYWWPNPDTSNGEPYIRKDGKVNPETKGVADKENFNAMLDAVNKLALAYYFTGNVTYAQKASDQLRAWFVSPDTRMNPNLNYAQIIKGKASDGTGLIDLRYVPQVIDYAAMIEPAKVFTQGDASTIKNWFTDYSNWLITSSAGKDQSDAENNHGTWYDAQIIAISSYLGNKGQAVNYAKRVQQLIETQIKADGSQPFELARTNSWDYSILNLDGMLQAGIAARTCGVDVLGYVNKNGVSIKNAVQMLAPYAKGDKKWPFQQINGFDKTEIKNVLPVAQFEYKDSFGLNAEQTRVLDSDTTIQLAYPIK